MPERPARLTKPTLDKDLDKLTHVEDTIRYVTRPLVAPGIALIFLGLAMLFTGFYVLDRPRVTLTVAASALAGYMALNIGAKDVANNVGAAVGARAITIPSALIMAAIFEILGATLAGGPVIRTVSSHIVDTNEAANTGNLAWLMMAALLSAAVWINLATWLKAPVSTTHAIVGAVVGAGIASSGLSLVNWPLMLLISSAWVVTPIFGGTLAALFLFFIKTFIIYREDKIDAGRYWIPILIGVMAGIFATYLLIRTTTAGTLSFPAEAASSVVVGLIGWLIARPLVIRQSAGLDNKNSALRKLFRLPLVGSAALLSFAHGANDVANAIGPLAAIVRAGCSRFVSPPNGPAPLWVVMIGACGISVGLLLYGPRLIRLVGQQITKLNPMRAYCVALSAASTVIVASSFGLPVSSTHVAVGSVFGVGFFREWYTTHSKRRARYMRHKAHPQDPEDDEPEERNVDEIRRRRLVRRSHFMTIAVAWVVTVPVSAALAAVVYWVMVALFV